LSAPKSKLAASTKPPLAGPIVFGVLLFWLGVPISAAVLSLLLAGETPIPLLILLIVYGVVVAWLWVQSIISLSVFLFLCGVSIVAFILSFLTDNRRDAALLFLWLTGYGVVVAWLWMQYRALREWSRRNDWDYNASQTIGQRLHDIGGRNEPLSDRSSGMRVIQGATVGEISQHFDQRVNASVSGWLHHELGLHGWGVGGSIGRVGLGVGQSASAAHRASTSTSQG
jgi:hypothetical protein